MGKIIWERHGKSEFPFFKFESKEIKDIESCLTKESHYRHRQRYDLKKVRDSGFIMFLEQECFNTWYLYWQVDRNFHLFDIKHFTKAFKEAEKYLEKIQKGFNLFIPRTGEDMGAPFGNLNDECRSQVNEIIPKFNKVIGMIESAVLHEKQNRVQRVGYKTDFTKRVAHIFRLCLGKPSMVEDGPFMEVMRIALESLRVEKKNPTRAVRRVLSLAQNS